MANHYEIKPDENGLALRMAMKALRSANGQATANPGSVYIPNGDGTGTLIGAQASDGAGGLAPFVNDTTPPGKPTGVSATSTWGIIYANWDGTLEGGVPADFAYVSVTIDGVEMAQMVKAGTFASQGWENGTIHTVGFTAYDSARDSVGNLTPNASETVEVSVTISDERAEIDAKVDAAEQAANQAAQDAQEAWDKAEQQAQAVADAAEKAQQAADKADQAMSDLSETADELTGQITQVTTKVNGVEQDVSELSTSVSGAVTTAQGALTAATEAKQTAEGVSASATQALEKADSALNKASEVELTADGLSTQVTAAMDTATDALNKAAEVEVTADGIQADLTKNYVSKTDAANTYTTKTEFKATSDGLQADISEVTTTAEGALEKANSLEVTAEGLRSDLTETTTTADSALKKANTTEVTVNGMKQTLTETTNTANSALSKSTSLETSVNGIKTQVESVSKTASSALTQASAAQQDITGFKTTVSNTYETKKDADDAMAQEVLDRNSAITQKANQILSEVKSNYVDKATGQTYASKTYVDQREDSILQAVETNYQSKDGMSSYYTKTQIDQQRDSIELGVSQSISDIQVGGRNLLRETEAFSNTDVSSSTNGYLRSGWTVQGSKYGRLTVRGGTKSGSTLQAIAEYLVNDFDLGEEFTFSFYVKGTGGKVRAFFYGETGYVTAMRVSSSNGLAASGYGDGNTDLPVTDDWKRVWVVYRLNSTGDTSKSKYALIRTDSTTSGKTVYVCGCKLEKGNRATDWSPAPEDDSTKLSSLSLDLNGITGKVSDLKGNQSSFQQTINGFEGRLTTAEGNATTAKNNASTALSTANTAKSTADSASKTASTASTNATNAVNTANSAKTTATNAQTTANTANSTASTAKSTADSAKTTATNAQNTANAAKKQTYHSASGTSGTTGYVRFAQVKFSRSYTNRPVFFALSNRGQVQSNVWVQWSNANSNDPSLASIKADGGINVWAHKTATSTWEIIAQKSEGYDTIYVNDYSNNNGSGCAVSWVNVQLSSVPSGSTAATRLAGKRNSADIDNAAKTATNYISFSTNGLVVGTNSGGTGQSGLQGNVRLYSGGMEVRNGTTVLARYGASTIELGINSTSSVIKMCGGTLTIKTGTSNSVTYNQIQGTNSLRLSVGSATAHIDIDKTKVSIFGGIQLGTNGSSYFSEAKFEEIIGSWGHPVGSLIFLKSKNNGNYTPSDYGITWGTWQKCAIGLSNSQSPFYALDNISGGNGGTIHQYTRANNAAQKWWLDVYPGSGNRVNFDVWIRTA